MAGMDALNHIPIADGHIESILIGFDFSKVAFQTWNARQLNLMFIGSDYVQDNGCVNADANHILCC